MKPIKKVVKKIVKKGITLDDLARMVQVGFAEMDKRFENLTEEMNGRFASIEKRIDKIEERLNKIENDIRYIYGSLNVIHREIADIKERLEYTVHREELNELKKRVLVLEKKLGL